MLGIERGWRGFIYRVSLTPLLRLGLLRYAAKIPVTGSDRLKKDVTKFKSNS
jgi:hypothetical protein